MAQLEPFGINKIYSLYRMYTRAKSFYADFIAILVYLLYNVLLTCHLHNYNSNSVLTHPLYEVNCAP